MEPSNGYLFTFAQLLQIKFVILRPVVHGTITQTSFPASAVSLLSRCF